MVRAWSIRRRFGSLRSKLRQTLAAARANGASTTGSPRALAELTERLALRSPGEWERMLEALLDLERAGRTGADIGLDDLARFALAWRIREKSAAKIRR